MGRWPGHMRRMFGGDSTQGVKRGVLSAVRLSRNAQPDFREPRPPSWCRNFEGNAAAKPTPDEESANGPEKTPRNTGDCDATPIRL